MKRASIKVISIALVMITIFALAPLSASAVTEVSTAGLVSVSSGNLNVRSAASTASPVLKSLPKGSHVTLVSKMGDWWYVEYAQGKYGYCSAPYISQVPSTYTVVSKGDLNVRSGAGTSYGVVGWLNPGEYAVVLATSGTWYKVLFEGGKVGFASNKYLSRSGGGGGNSGYSAVSLSVPNYKQTDARWAGTTIAPSGRTIADIGCATTALAMSESYRTGTTITPDAMSKKLGYTSGGAVYWPGNYKAYTASDYLGFLYNQLKSGKTLLVGAKNASGGQHWAVVTGFSGGALAAANFTMNDPGTVSRTTLQQLFGAYPYFYKLMYY